MDVKYVITLANKEMLVVTEKELIEIGRQFESQGFAVLANELITPEQILLVSYPNEIPF